MCDEDWHEICDMLLYIKMIVGQCDTTPYKVDEVGKLFPWQRQLGIPKNAQNSASKLQRFSWMHKQHFIRSFIFIICIPTAMEHVLTVLKLIRCSSLILKNNFELLTVHFWLVALFRISDHSDNATV